MERLGLVTPETTAFVLIDIQERLLPHIANKETLVENTNKLISGAEILGVPLLATEQYPRGLGHTDRSVRLPADCEVTEKICFSCVQSGPFMERLKETGAGNLVLFGIETHICVFKTALDALKETFQVHVVADAVGSRKDENRLIALERMRQSGVFIVSTEMILFQLIEEAGNDTFKAISKLIK